MVCSPRSLLDKVVDDNVGLKEQRQNIFNDWADALLNKDWESCDTCTTLLLHTLAIESVQRKDLQSWVDKVNVMYQVENEKLQQAINAQNNPFQREQLKKKKPEVDQWRAVEIHNKFFGVFKNNNLIDAT